MRIACIQTNPQEDLGANLAEVASFIAQAARGGAQVVVLPEMFTYMGNDARRLETASRIGQGVFATLAELAREHRISLIGGSHAEKADGSDKVYNTAVAFGPDGRLRATYRKIHLFNLRDADGKALFCESEVFLSGRQTCRFPLQVGGKEWEAGLAICYDLRFPELFRDPRARAGAPAPEILFLPAAFTHQTGQDHWEVLLRARAIENQCFVVACNQTGFFAGGKKRNWGHSLIVDPWGRVLASLGEEVGVLMADIDSSGLAEARSRLPALADRSDLFL